MPPPPTAALRQFAESKVILAADPKDATTLAPAITELTSLIRQEPRNSDFYFLRASLSCYAHANPKEVLDDITKSMSLRDPAKPGPYPTLKDHYALKAKIEFDNVLYQDAMRDLDAAIKEDYESAQHVFNDGNTKPTTTTQPCVWTLPDFDTLTQRFPTDYRPLLYRGLYLSFFLSFNLDSDYKPVLDAFERATALNPAEESDSSFQTVRSTPYVSNPPWGSEHRPLHDSEDCRTFQHRDVSALRASDA